MLHRLVLADQASNTELCPLKIEQPSKKAENIVEYSVREIIDNFTV